jgi:hypothetical protein
LKQVHLRLDLEYAGGEVPQLYLATD